MGEISITDGSVLRLREDSELKITKVGEIAPLAAHIKEVNHIDPLTVDAFHVNEVRNIDPISVAKFNVTNLPQVNLSVRQLPPVVFNVNRLPAVSVGTHQDFCIPSQYTLRARVLGIELLRLNLDGTTTVLPRERHRREQGRDPGRSFAEPVTAGNAAIPSSCRVSSDGPCPPAGPGALSFGAPTASFHVPAARADGAPAASRVTSGD